MGPAARTLGVGGRRPACQGLAALVPRLLAPPLVGGRRGAAYSWDAREPTGGKRDEGAAVRLCASQQPGRAVCALVAGGWRGQTVGRRPELAGDARLPPVGAEPADRH